LRKCIELLDTFDPKRTTVDAYVSDAECMQDKKIGEVEHKFIHQVFYGCSRYKKFLKLFVVSFLHRSPSVAIRAEQTLYMILAYMLFFRLEELGVPEFGNFMFSGIGTIPALHCMIQYAMSEEELNKWVKEEWIKAYDKRYIEEEIIGRLQARMSDVRPLLEDLELKATGTIVAAEGQAPKEKKYTTPEPFQMTKPRPRLIPEPEAINRKIKAKPVPATIMGTSLAEVEEEKKKRLEEEKARVREKYAGCVDVMLETSTRRDPNEREELSKRVEAQKMAECTFKPQPPKKYAPPTEEAVVKHNASAVLREDALLRKKQAKEYAELKRYEAELHDSSEYYNWQADIQEQDQIEEEKRVQRRKVEMQLTREEAIAAKEALLRKNRILAEHHKEQGKEMLAQLEQERMEDLLERKQLVQETMEERGHAKEAGEAIIKEKKTQAEELRQQKEADLERKRAEDEQEMERRKDLIRQIRALEKVHVERFKSFDPGEQPCQGLLDEMSLSELRERLKIVQAQRAKEIEDKRERQLEKKLEKQQELSEKAEALGKIRDMAKEEAVQRHAAEKQRKIEIEERQQKYREKCIEEAAVRIAEKKKAKRAEELRLRKELKEISIKRQFLSANAEMVEAKAHGEQQAGLEREARERQTRSLIEQKRKNDIKVKELSLHHLNKQNEVEEYKVMQEAMEARLRQSKKDDVALKSHLKGIVTSAREVQKTSETIMRAELGHSANQYMKKTASRMAIAAAA